MKKYLSIIAIAIATTFAASAQEEEEPNYWKTQAVLDLGFDQTGLTNWAQGGYNTVSLSAGIDAKANYAKELMSWDNRLQLQYGFLWSQDKSNLLQKKNDRLYFESKWAYKTQAESTWKYSASFDFRSQFTDTYDKYQQQADGKWTGTLKSGFFSPAYTTIAIGIDWVPNEWFDMNVAPLTGGFTICNIESLRKGYGMKLIDSTFDPAIGSSYHSALFQFGAQVKMNFKVAFNEVLSYDTQLVLFTDYLNNPFKQVRVNWDNVLRWQANKFLKLEFKTWLLYDPIVTFEDGAHRVQFKEFFQVNFTYTFASKNKK